MNYKVPHFGTDRDIVTSMNSLQKAEGIVKHQWGSVRDKPVDMAGKTNYNFKPELDSDIIDTNEHYSAAEKRLGKDKKKDAKADEKKKEGADAKKDEAKKEGQKTDEKKDAKEGEAKKTEAKEGEAKKADAKEGEDKKADDKKADDKKTDDKKDDEKKTDAKKADALVQSQVDIHLHSDPICHSAGCTQYLHPKKEEKLGYPINYFVPNFGKDKREVLTTWNSLDVAQKQLNHVWEFNPDAVKKPEDPTKYNFKPELDDDIKISNVNEAGAQKWLDIANKKTDTKKDGDKKEDKKTDDKKTDDKKTDDKKTDDKKTDDKKTDDKKTDEKKTDDKKADALVQ